jgi:hypothetical protein
MATTLPTLTKTIDNTFVTTWYEIRPEAIDNILSASVVWTALKQAGCLKAQDGGDYITRTVRYALPSTLAVEKGDVFSQGETETKTMGMWTWRQFSGHVQRSVFDDAKNTGKFKIVDYVKSRLQDTRDAMAQQLETYIMAAAVAAGAETGKAPQSLNDLVQLFATYQTGTYGGIARSNTWWNTKYKQLTAPYAVNLLDDMKNLYNTISAGLESPNLLISDQTLFELYEGFAMDASQIVKEANTMLADLGYDTLKFKGKTMIWSANATANHMMFLNTNHLDVVYNSNMWFDTPGWKDIPLQGERIMHILASYNVVSAQVRRHGRLYA